MTENGVAKKEKNSGRPRSFFLTNIVDITCATIKKKTCTRYMQKAETISQKHKTKGQVQLTAMSNTDETQLRHC